MNKRSVIVIVLVFILIFGVWLARRSTSSLPPSMPSSPVAVPEPSAPLPVIPLSPPPPPVVPKKIIKPTSIKKPSLPKPAAVPTPAPAAPLIPVPALQPRPTIPIPVAVPETLPQEWRGNNDTSIQHNGQIVVQTDEQWIHFWAEHHPDEAAPEVDFSRNMVVGVFLGERPADNFEVTITNIRTQGNALMVDYLQIDPPVGTYQVGKNSFPYDIKVIPRTPLHVKFNQMTQQDLRPTTPPARK